jgi:adenylate cyclase
VKTLLARESSRNSDIASPTIKPLVVLFSDISDSCGLYQNYGDVAAVSTINTCLSLLREIITQHGGRVVKSIGDELMVVFDDITKAFCAACIMQMTISSVPIFPSRKLSIHIGLHYGQVLQQGNDIFGDTVNIAARLVEIAKTGQIITTERTVIASNYNDCAQKLCSVRLRGQAHPENIYEIVWQRCPKYCQGQTSHS